MMHWVLPDNAIKLIAESAFCGRCQIAQVCPHLTALSPRCKVISVFKWTLVAHQRLGPRRWLPDVPASSTAHSPTRVSAMRFTQAHLMIRVFNSQHDQVYDTRTQTLCATTHALKLSPTSSTWTCSFSKQKVRTCSLEMLNVHWLISDLIGRNLV